MTESDIKECIRSIKVKNSEGYDRIPQRVLVDGEAQLLKPLSHLFYRIYQEKCVPEQWLVSKIIPIHKKGDKSKVENYRPIANLCCTSKIFEKLILKRIGEIEKEKKTDLTGKPQHGFKKKKYSNCWTNITVTNFKGPR